MPFVLFYENCRDLCVHRETAEICLWAKHIFLSLELLFWGQTISRSNPAFVFLLVGYLSLALSGRRSIAVWENGRKIRKTSSGIVSLAFLFHLTNDRNKRKVTFLLRKKFPRTPAPPTWAIFMEASFVLMCLSPIRCVMDFLNQICIFFRKKNLRQRKFIGLPTFVQSRRIVGLEAHPSDNLIQTKYRSSLPEPLS